MPERQDYSALLVAHLGRIDRVAAALCRKHGLDPDEVDEFASWAKAKLIENDYAILRKFRGESKLTTYLTVVLNRLYRDYRVWRWGRWRPSAAARRRGPVAVRLETLVCRDGMTVPQAAEMLRARSESNLSDREAAELLDQLPGCMRGRPKQVDDATLETTASATHADDVVMGTEAEAHRQATREALANSMQGLSDEDREIVKMHYFAGATVAQIARVLGIEQKPLYRRLERILRQLRRALEAEGVSGDQVRDILDEHS